MHAYGQDIVKQPGPPKPPRPTEMTDPIAILKKVDEASKKVKVAMYNGETHCTGWLAKGRLSVQGRVIIGSVGSVYGFGKCLFDVQITDPKTQKKQHLTVGSNGKICFLVDHERKMVHQNKNYRVLGRIGAPATMIGMKEFVFAEPFSDEINGDKALLEGHKKIGDVDCYVIRVIYAKQQQESVWYFSKKDFLPRRREIVRVDPRTGERGLRVTTVTNLVVNPKFAKDPFELVIPEGYKTTDKIAE